MMTALCKSALLAAVLILIPFQSLASDALTLRMGTDLTHYKNETSIYSIGIESFNSSGFGSKAEFGGWTDIGENRRCSPFGSALLGKRFGSYNGFNLTGLLGFAIIGNPDAALSTTFQFTEEVVLGYQWIGLGYKHFSNAGLKEPNQGRDYISITLAFPF